jgi:hypothetical protein
LRTRWTSPRLTMPLCLMLPAAASRSPGR